MTMSRRGGTQIAPADLQVKEPPEVNADWSDVGKAVIPAAGASIRSAVANLRRLANEDAIGERQQIIDSTPIAGPAVHPMVARGVERQRTKLAEAIAKRDEIDADAAAANEDMAAVTPKDMSTLQQGVFSAGASAVPTLGALAAGIATKSPALAMAIGGVGGGAVQAGSTYGEARDKGASHETASKAAGIDAILESVGEALPLKVALKPGSAIAKRIVNTIAAESGQEAATQVMQDLNASLTYDPDITLAEAWQKAKVAAIAGGVGGSVYGAAGAAANARAKTPAPMHAEAEPAVEPPVEEPPAVVEPPAAVAPPVEPKEPTTAYDDLVPTRQPEPWEVQDETVAPPDLKDETVRAELQHMIGEAGWSEVGGKAIGAQSQMDVMRGVKTARELRDEGIDATTKWVGKAEWAQELGMTQADIAKAVENALAGKRLGKNQKMAVDYMLEIAQERLAHRQRIGEQPWQEIAEEIKAEGVEPVHQDIVDTDMVARASELDPDAVERAASQYENDDTAFMAEVRRVIREHEAANEDAGAVRRGEASFGSPQEGEGPLLETYSQEDLAKRERAAKDAAARKQSEEEAAERKRIADAQVDDFSLTGSDRAADTNPQQSTLRFNGLPLGAPANTITVPTAAAAGATPPTSASSSVGKDQARPDAIRTAMRELFGAPLNEKGLSKKYLGIYKIKPQTIRLQNRNDLRTASHEIGHHISNTNRPLRKAMRRNEAELVPIAPRPYLAAAIKQFGSISQALADGPTRRHLIEEGFAEFIAEYLTNPARVQTKTPTFLKEFEAWLQTEPKIAAALQQVAEMVGAHQALGPEDKILAKVGVFKPTVRERAAALAGPEAWSTYTQQVLDKWHPLKLMVADLSPGLAASKNPYVAARMLPGDAAVIEDWVSEFTSPYDYQKRLDPKNYGKPLKAILAQVMQGGEEELARFKAYLIARRAAELMKVGKENLFTKEEIAEGLKLETIQPGRKRLYEATANAIYAYNDRLLDYAVEGGLLSQETAAEFRKYANYIPFFREPEGDAKGGGSGNPFKRLTGGTQNVRDPIANLIQNTANIIHATNRNAMIAKAAELAESVPGGGRWLERVKVPMEAHNIATDRIIEELEKQGVQIDRTMASGMAAMQTFFTPSGKGDDRARIVVYKDQGELKAVQVNDPLLWKAMSNLPPLEMDFITKMLAFPARTLRAGVVLDPTFMVRNFVRDTLSATMQSKGRFLPGVSTAAGMKAQAQMSDSYKLWRAFGGSSSSQFQDSDKAAAAIQRMAKRGNFDARSIVSPMRLIEALEKIGSFTEYGSRIGEFKATYKPGDFDSALQAAFNSREVSTDFGMRGGNTALQVWTRLVPFMNPAMQGLYKTGRTLSGVDGKGAAAKAAVLGAGMALASVMLALSNSGEDWYDRIEEWEKATYWHFKLGGQVWRIPKPFEYGVFFASIPEAIALRAADAESKDDFRKRMLQVLSQVSIRAVPQIATLLAEPWANKSFFTGRKIVPDRQERLEPGLQSHPGTSKVAQVAGEAANVSPAIIDNLVRNTFGTIGVHVETVADLLLEQTGTFPAGREKSWQSWPAIKAFVRDPDNPNTKQLKDFYEALEKYRTAVATVKEYRDRGQEDKADAYAEEKADELQSAKQAEQASKRLAKMRKQLRSIDWDRDMSSAEKRSAANEKNAEMQDIATEHSPSVLYQAAKKTYPSRAVEGEK